MRSTLASLLFLTTALSAAEKSADNRIVAVTVYQTTALVTREVTVPDGVGTLELVVSPLPSETVPNSLYSEGTDGIRILNTRFRSRAIREDSREEVRKLQAKLRELAFATQRITADLKAVEENQKFLAKLEGFTGATMQHLTEKGLLSAETTIALAKYIMTTRVDRVKEIVAMQQQLAENKTQTEYATAQLEELSSGVQRTERDAVVVVDKANAAGGKVRLNYLVGSVHWKPQYKLRAGRDKEPVSLEYLAAVQGCDFHAPLKSSTVLESARNLLRAKVPQLAEDRYFHPDMSASTGLIRSGALAELAGLPGVV